MKSEITLTILERLIDGVHPITGELLPPDHLCCEEDIRAAFRHAMGCVAQQADAPAEARYVRRNGKLNAGRPWSPQDDEELLALYQSGVPVEEICRRTQRRARGVNNRLDALLCTPDGEQEDATPDEAAQSRAGLPWSPQEDARLALQWDAGEGVPALAACFGRSEYAIRCRLVRLGRLEDADKA